MKNSFIGSLVLICGAIVLTATAASAQMAYIDYYGYAYETGGFPTSFSGDQLTFEGVADFLTPEFEVDLGEVELTFYVHGLISTGEVDIGGGNVMINYIFGTMEAYVDPAKNAEWLRVLPTTAGPSSFTDGELFFRGDFTSFTLMVTAGGDGSFEGILNGLEGQALGEPCLGCAYTWGGAFTADSQAQIPSGYDLQMDGEFEIEAALPAQPTTWGQLKSLFR